VGTVNLTEFVAPDVDDPVDPDPDPAGEYTVPVGAGEIDIADYDAGEIVFKFDIAAAQATSDLTQPTIENFDTAIHSLELELPERLDVDEDAIDDLDALVDAVDGWEATYSSFEDELIAQFGPNAADDLITLTLQGVEDAGEVDVMFA